MIYNIDKAITDWITIVHSLPDAIKIIIVLIWISLFLTLLFQPSQIEKDYWRISDIIARRDINDINIPMN